MDLARFSALAIGFSLAGASMAQSLSAFGITPTPVRSGVSATGKVTISSAAPAGGTSVGISSNGAAASAPANVAIAAGATTGTFAIITHNSGYTKLVATLTATKALLERTATVTVLPANDSQFIGQTVPTGMVVNRTYSVTLQFKNTGATTWDAAHYYKLLSWNPVDNLTWGTKRLRLQNAPVASGQTGTFSGTVTAPSTIGTFNFQWRCVQDDIYDSFGSPSANVVITTGAGVDSAQFIGQTNVPTAIFAGQSFTPNIAFKNNGTSTWTSAAGYMLRSRNPYLNTYWGTNTVSLPSTVAPQTNITFSPTLTAPTVPGTYTFAWFMVHNSAIGQIPPSVDIIVKSPDSADFLSQTIGTTANIGSQFDPQITFKNTGFSTWSAASGYWLVSASPLLNTVWGVSRCQFPANTTVTPGASVTFIPHVTAPNVPGTYLMQWQLSKNDVPFGQLSQAVNINVNNATPEDSLCTSQSVPIFATAGQHYVAQVTYKNVGTADWPLNTAIGIYPLMDNTWALPSMASSSIITKGNSRTFTLDLVAPFVPGNYPLQFRMRNMNTNTWFGQASTIVTVAVAPSPYAQSPWPGVRGGRNRMSGRGFGSGAIGVRLWTYAASSYFQDEPSIGADGTVYIGNNNHVFYAFNGSTGAVRWSLDLGSPIMSAPAIGADGTVYVGTCGIYNSAVPAKFFALDGATGAVKWSYSKTTLGEFQSPSIGADGTVYVPAHISDIFAFDGATGALKWDAAVPGTYESAPAIAADGTVIIGSIGFNRLIALNPSNGALLWTAPISGGTSGTPVTGVDGTIYVGTQGHQVLAIDPATRTVKWAFTAGGSITRGPALGADGTVYCGSFDNKLYALNGATGALKWSFLAGGQIYSAPSIGADGTVYVADNSKLYALNGATGALKFAAAVGIVVASGPAIGADGTIYIGTCNSTMVAVK